MGTQWDETRQWWFDQEQKRWRPVAEWQGEPPPAPPPTSGPWSDDRQHWFDQEQKRWRPAAEWQGEPPPPPTPRKRGQRWPWVVGGAVALVVLMGVCLAAVNSSSSSLQSTATVATPTAAAKATAQPTATPTPAPTRNGSCGPQPCANDNYGWIVVVSDVKYDVPSGNQFIKPEAGNVFVTLSVTFTNKLDSEQHANPFQFVLLDGAGVKHTVALLGPCESWQAVNVTKGGTFGPKCLAFQAAAGKPTGLVLVWTPSFGDYQMKLT